MTVEQIRDAVKKEVDGPGKLLGYRAMQNTLRQEHELKVPRDLVYVVMQDGVGGEMALVARWRWKSKTKAKKELEMALISFILLTDTTN